MFYGEQSSTGKVILRSIVTSLNTTVDFDLVNGTGSEAGDFSIGVNLGFGF